MSSKKPRASKGSEKSKSKKKEKEARSVPGSPREDVVETPDNIRRVDFVVTIRQGKNLSSLRGGEGKVNTLVRYSFFGQTDVETPVIADDKNPQYEFAGEFKDVEVNEDFLNTVLTNPFIFYIDESDKKNKRTPLGQVAVDLRPLAAGELNMEIWCPVTYLSDEPQPAAELEVGFTINQSLLPPGAWDVSKLVTMHVEGLFAPPPKWYLPADADPSSNPYAYVATCALPYTADANQILEFAEGALTMPKETEATVETTAKPSVGVLLPEEQAKEAELMRFRTAERALQSVRWEGDLTMFMVPEAAGRIQQMAESKTPLPIEIRRILGKDYEGMTDPNARKYVGQALLDLSELLQPGVNSITARVKLGPGPPTEEDEEVAKTAAGRAKDSKSKSTPNTARGSSSQGKKKDEKAKVERKITTAGRSSQKEKEKGRRNSDGGKSKAKDGDKKTAASAKRSPSKRKEKLTLEPEEEEIGNAYQNAGAYIIVTLTLDRPIVPRPPTPKPVYKVSDFIPMRPRMPRPPQASLPAKEEFQLEIDQITQQLMDEYKKMFGEQVLNGTISHTKEAREERKKKFVYELNAAGRYFSFKEQLKVSVVRIVREKFQQTSIFSAKNEMQMFLNDLYMNLMDHMHETLNKTFNDVHEIPIPTNVDDVTTLKRYAREAEVNLDYELAARHYQERITRDESNPDFWYDYGAFCLRTDNLAKGEECFQQAIANRESHALSLLAYGALSIAQTKYDRALTLLRVAADVAPNDPVTWVTKGLICDIMDKDEEADAAYARAVELDEPAHVQHKRTVEMAMAAVTPGQKPPLMPLEPPNVYIRAAQFLLDMHLCTVAERALGKDLLLGADRSIDAQLCLAQQYMHTQEFANATPILSEIAEHTEDPRLRMKALVLLGHVTFMQQAFDVTIHAYEAALVHGKDHLGLLDDLFAVYLRLGALYLSNERLMEAKKVYLEACRVAPSSFAWLGVGLVCYRLQQWDEAEDALSEANILNHLDPTIWGYLVLVCLAKEKLTEADQAMTQALKLNIADPSLLCEIGANFARADRLIDAEMCLNRSAAIEDSAHTRVLLADVYFDQGKRSEAIANYKIALSDAEGEDLARALKSLAEILGDMGRGDEAADYEAQLHSLLGR